MRETGLRGAAPSRDRRGPLAIAKTFRTKTRDHGDAIDATPSRSGPISAPRRRQFVRRLGMSGCRDAWSSTRPRTNRESAPSLCSMVITSTMCRSTAKLPSSSSSRTVRTASTTAPVMRSAIFGWSFVRSAVRATLWSSAAVLRVHADGARVEDFERLVPREVVALGDDARVHALADVSFRALQKFARQQHHGRRAVARDFVLRGGGARDHGRRRVPA